MTKQVVTTAALLLAGGLIALCLMNLTRPADAQVSGGNGGNFVVAAGGTFCVLCDTATGRSWVMLPKPDAQKYAWFPVKRLDSDSDIMKWRIGKGAEDKEESSPAPMPRTFTPAPAK